MIDGWARYRIVVENIFKRGIRGRRGETSLWMSAHSVMCKCPKIRIGHRYLLLAGRAYRCRLCTNVRDKSSNYANFHVTSISNTSKVDRSTSFHLRLMGVRNLSSLFTTISIGTITKNNMKYFNE
ncbi:hypothetical protein DICVIV_11735 [Dictyocaulus viviparus]|uniref:Netrin module non-TIMP type domain-containing protein n=1 Tax=Dictyocaulus viviparus TaxID=29172 RepID=A0A0D8XCF8_DICVI|nr:hypothetical protein DICVIV_11735 [Dictyocaulus viviparus]